MHDLQILIEPSEYRHLNAGDVAMLMMTVRRLRSAAPSATIRVLTDDPEVLQSLCSGVTPVRARGKRAWAEPAAALTPHVLAPWSRRLLQLARRRAPGVVRLAGRAALRLRHGSAGDLHAYWKAATTSDAVVLSGMGAINDSFPRHAWGLLETLELAIDSGAVTAMMGQGLGPLRDRALRSRLASLLPRVDLIALREGRGGLALLRELDVPADKVVVTGDDAIELAYEARSSLPGHDLGVNVRIADYSAIGRRTARRIADVTKAAAAQQGADIVPLAVSRYENTDDGEALAEMFGTRAVPAAPRTAVAELLGATARCRVVVAASYHAAVFALSMGVPAVAVASSDYYRAKFAGLAEQFGGGCSVIEVAETGFEARLQRAIDDAWRDADRLRPLLLHAAKIQIDAGRAAYDRLAAMIRERKGASQFNRAEQSDSSWYERATACARLIAMLAPPAGAELLRVADVGCGDMKLREALAGAPVSYHGFDLLPQNAATRVFDVRRDRLPHEFDVATLLGVTEYLDDVSAALAQLSQDVPYAIVSHAARRSADGADSNLRWHTHLTEEEMVGVLRAAGFEIVTSTAAGGTRLWLCASVHFQPADRLLRS